MGLLKALGIGKYLKKVKDYTDQRIENLIGEAPEALDTIQELSEAIKDNKDIIDVLNGAITNKVSKSELNTEIAKVEETIVDNERIVAGAIVNINKNLNNKADKSDIENIKFNYISLDSIDALFGNDYYEDYYESNNQQSSYNIHNTYSELYYTADAKTDSFIEGNVYFNNCICTQHEYNDEIMTGIVTFSNLIPDKTLIETEYSELGDIIVKYYE